MKRFIVFLAVCALAVPVTAQMAGLPVADGATPLGPSVMRASGGIVLGDNMNLYGGRFWMGITEEITAFGDAGILSPDRGDNGFGGQVGGLYALPLDVPFEVAARATLGYGKMDQKVFGTSVDISITTIGAGVVGSTIIDAFTIYGYLGLNHTRSKVSYTGGSSSDSDTDPALGAGVAYEINPQLSVYGEIMHIDDPWFGVGVRYQLP